MHSAFHLRLEHPERVQKNSSLDMDSNPLATERRQRRYIEAIDRDVQLSEWNRTPITVLSPSPQHHSLNTLFMYCQLLKETFLDMDHVTQAKCVLADFCRREFGSNQATLCVIDEFEGDYERHCPTWWYTRDCFVRPLLNDALRTYDIEVIKKFGFFIKDLHRQLEELHQTLPSANFTVYSGQR